MRAHSPRRPYPPVGMGTSVKCLTAHRRHAAPDGGCRVGDTAARCEGGHRCPALAAAPGPVASLRPRRPRDRATAVRRGPRAADHLPARSRRPPTAARRRAVPRSGHAVRHPRPLRDPAAARQRSRAGRARRGPRARCARRRPARCGGCCARTGTSTAARRCATGSSPSWPTSSTSTLRPSAETADAIYDQHRRAAGHRRLPPPRALRAVQDRGAGHHRRPEPTTCPRTPRWPRTRPGRGGSSRRSAPTATWSRAARLAGRGGRARQGRRRRHRRLRRLHARAGGAAALLHRARGRLGRPQPRRRPHRPAGAARGRPDLPVGAGRRRDGRPRPTALRRHLLLEMARMSCDDGLVMTLHPGVRRGHHGPTTRRFGPDTGNDIPIPVEFTDAAAPPAGALRHPPRLPPGAVHPRRDRVLPRARAAGRVLSRGLRRASPWWFLDAPHAIRRFRAAVTETVGFSRTSGFVDDTRAFCSIPARHDMSRRVDAGWLAQLVAEHQLDEDEAARPRSTWSPRSREQVFKL